MQFYSLPWQFDVNFLGLYWLLNFHIVSSHHIAVRIFVLTYFSSTILAAYVVLVYDLDIIHKFGRTLPC